MSIKHYDILLSNGIGISFILPDGFSTSKALQNHREQEEHDLSIFFMQELCLVDGQRMGIDFYGELSMDDYMKIVEVLGRIMTPL